MAQLTGIIHEYYYTQPPNTHHPTLCLHFTPKIIKKDLEYVFLYLFFENIIKVLIFSECHINRQLYFVKLT